MSPLDLVSSDTRRKLLQHLKREGSLSIDEAMDRLDMARTTVREHLIQLKEQGLVERSADRRGRGRPRHRYRITAEADVLFPSRDGELMGRLLDFLEEEGEDDLVEAFFRTYWASRTQRAKDRLAPDAVTESDGSFEDRLDALTDFLDDEGFMPEVDREDGAVTVRECNCPFPESVKRSRIPCVLEKEFFEEVLGREVCRAMHMPDGEPACTYDVDEPADG
jgi:predicted ArsR family transcriptional regulator